MVVLTLGLTRKGSRSPSAAPTSAPEGTAFPQVNGDTRPPGVVAPPVDGLPVWMVPLATWRHFAPSVCWVVGCHGGAGASTVAAAMDEGIDAGRYWPVLEAPGTAWVMLVARTHAAGLRAARDAARQWASGVLAGDVRLVGLAAVADAPGRPPRPLRDLLGLVSGAFPRVWRLPWVEDLRLGEPPDPAHPALSTLGTDLRRIIPGGRYAHPDGRG